MFISLVRGRRAARACTAHTLAWHVSCSALESARQSSASSNGRGLRAVASALGAGHALLHRKCMAKRMAPTAAFAALRAEADGLRAVAGALGTRCSRRMRCSSAWPALSAPVAARRPFATHLQRSERGGWCHALGQADMVQQLRGRRRARRRPPALDALHADAPAASTLTLCPPCLM